jgi:hypothetical protein
VGPLAGLSQYQDYQALNMLPTGNGNYYEATIPTEDIDPRFDFMYLFEVWTTSETARFILTWLMRPHTSS